MSELTEAEQACLDIYMGLHVSEVRDQSRQVYAAWHVGSRIYDSRKRKERDDE